MQCVPMYVVCTSVLSILWLLVIIQAFVLTLLCVCMCVCFLRYFELGVLCHHLGFQFSRGWWKGQIALVCLSM
jgi:hypothetical protein